MKRKPLIWIASSKKDLKSFPEEVQKIMGYGLLDAQEGGKHKNAKPLLGFGGADIIEIVDEDASGTYRTVYTVRFKDMVFVLHAFQKKSKQGIKTPKLEIDLLKNRLKQAQEQYNELTKKK
ncbi:type II toxin-antitoxin system RelE/ParE family toxin [soil metagenome]